MMDYEKLELEVYDLIKSYIAQARFQSSQSSARAYSMEIATLLQGIKSIQELMILKAQLKNMVGAEK